VSSRTVTIAARHNGPPGSAHGGYAAGLVGTAIPGPAEVTLLAPPPLETPMELRSEGDGVVLRAGDRGIATGRPATVEVGPPPLHAIDVVRDAMPAREALRSFHPFPTCFGCGPDRPHGDGMHLFAGEIDPPGGVWGCTWIPEGGGSADPLLVWAALDCPSCGPSLDPTGERPIVLGRFAVDVLAAVPAGVEHRILSVSLRQEGRKRTNAVWLVDPADEVLAVGRATWIELRPQDAAARRGDGR